MEIYLLSSWDADSYHEEVVGAYQSKKEAKRWERSLQSNPKYKNFSFFVSACQVDLEPDMSYWGD